MQLEGEPEGLGDGLVSDVVVPGGFDNCCKMGAIDGRCEMGGGISYVGPMPPLEIGFIMLSKKT